MRRMNLQRPLDEISDLRLLPGHAAHIDKRNRQLNRVSEEIKGVRHPSTLLTDLGLLRSADTVHSVFNRTLMVIPLMLMATACGEPEAACDRQCGQIRTLFTAPCGSQHTGTPADCAAWVSQVSTMTRNLNAAFQGKQVEQDVSEVLPRLMTAVGDFEALKCSDVKVDNVSSTDARQSKCNEALIATRGDLGSLYFSADVPD
ncbi:hypothetical protein LX86_008328 [Lentzea aerocolonigenes]|nr:hypothetical protein [Lentzea aerocolonigenes]